MRNLHWTPDGHINVAEVVKTFTIQCHEMFRRILYVAWADAYAHGWSDGRADRDPNERENPYARENQTRGGLKCQSKT